MEMLLPGALRAVDRGAPRTERGGVLRRTLTVGRGSASAAGWARPAPTPATRPWRAVGLTNPLTILYFTACGLMAVAVAVVH